MLKPFWLKFNGCFGYDTTGNVGLEDGKLTFQSSFI